MSKENELTKELEEYWREEVEQLKADSVHSSSYLAAEALAIIERFVQNNTIITALNFFNPIQN